MITKLSMRKSKQSKLLLAVVVLVLLLAVTLGACQSEPISTGPLLWQVSAEDGTVLYLFGSIHMAKEGVFPLDERIMNAYAASDSLAVEADLIAYTTNSELIAEMNALMSYPAGTDIYDEIDSEIVDEAYNIILAERGQAVADAMLSLRPAVWANTLSNIAYTKAGLLAGYGIDTYFLNTAKQEGKEILEVESIEAQMEMMLGFSAETDLYLLQSSFAIDEGVEAINQLYQAWLTGDEEELIAITTEDLEAATPEIKEEYSQKMIIERNILMADAAEQYMAEGKNVFFLVGALHMVGEDGIAALLSDRGYTVTPIY